MKKTTQTTKYLHKYYTKYEINGGVLTKIDAALKTLTREDIPANSTAGITCGTKPNCSILDIAIEKKVCPDNAKIQPLSNFHVSIGKMNYECKDVDQKTLPTTNGKIKDDCYDAIKVKAYNEYGDVNSFTLGMTHNPMEEENNFNTWEAFTLTQLNGAHKIYNPHLSIIKGGKDKRQAEKCFMELNHINNQYHNNKEDNYYGVINNYVGEIIETNDIGIDVGSGICLSTSSIIAK